MNATTEQETPQVEPATPTADASEQAELTIEERLAERLADERRSKRMAHDSMAHRVKCPKCNDGRTYTFRKSGELLFCCYGCGCQFDDEGAVR